MKRISLRLTAWIACMAILMASFVPSISHALVATSGGATPWGEVCTSVGASLVKSGLARNPLSTSSDQKSVHLEHCPFCLTHAGTMALPLAANSMLPAVSASYPVPTLFYQSSRPLFAWSAAQARAPPSAS